MSSESPSRLRRIVSFVIPVCALFALVLVGRTAAPAATAASIPVVSAAPDVAANDAGVVAPTDAAAKPTDVSTDALPSAVEQLPDGGVVVDLNLASEEDLRKLPGVGPTRARKILELRARLGRFKSVDDLARIKGFGRATLKRLRPLTRVGA